MINIVFLFTIVALIATIFFWAFRNLPREEWQMIASVPIRKKPDGAWQGLNLTYYGFFNASAMAFACIMVVVLMGSIRAPMLAVIAVMASGLLLALPSAKIVARIVERKRHTFTVAGAAFVLIIFLPWLIALFNLTFGAQFSIYLPPLPMFAAVAIAYAFGEALGRLACISFGCCYGKTLDKLRPSLRKRLNRYAFRFTGRTKKLPMLTACMGCR